MGDFFDFLQCAIVLGPSFVSLNAETAMTTPLTALSVQARQNTNEIVPNEGMTLKGLAVPLAVPLAVSESRTNKNTLPFV